MGSITDDTPAHVNESGDRNIDTVCGSSVAMPSTYSAGYSVFYYIPSSYIVNNHNFNLKRIRIDPAITLLNTNLQF